MCPTGLSVGLSPGSHHRSGLNVETVDQVLVEAGYPLPRAGHQGGRGLGFPIAQRLPGLFCGGGGASPHSMTAYPLPRNVDPPVWYDTDVKLFEIQRV